MHPGITGGTVYYVSSTGTDPGKFLKEFSGMGSGFNIDLSGIDNFFHDLVTHGLLWGRYLIVLGIGYAIYEFAIAHNVKRGIAGVVGAIIGIICLIAAPNWAGID